MKRYILNRLLSMLLVLFGVSVIIFTLIRLVPGNIVDILYGGEAQITEQTRQAVLKEYGLDQPMPVQYVDWLSHVVRGDLGRSMRTRELVSAQIQRSLPVTAELGIFSLLFAVVIATPLAIVSAVKRDSPLDLATRLFGLLGLSMPNFWIATLLLLVASIWFQWMPSVDWAPLLQDPGRNLSQMVMPTISLGMILVAANMRMLRSTLVEVLQEQYIVTARGKGLSPMQVLNRHALKNALIPVITIMGMQMGNLLGGAVIIEQIFSLPGIGSLTLFAVGNRDYSLLQGTILIFALIYAVINLIVDLTYGVLDPRIRYE